MQYLHNRLADLRAREEPTLQFKPEGHLLADAQKDPLGVLYYPPPTRLQMKTFKLRTITKQLAVKLEFSLSSPSLPSLITIL